MPVQTATLALPSTQLVTFYNLVEKYLLPDTNWVFK